MSEDLSMLLQRIRRLRDRSQHLSAEADRVSREADKLMRGFRREMSPPSPPSKGDAPAEN